MAESDNQAAQVRSPARRKRSTKILLSILGILVDQNFSEGGVFVATYKPLPIGSAVALQLNMPNGDKLVAKGTVRWLRSASNIDWPGMGVQFEELEEKVAMRIKRFLVLREPIFYLE